MKVKSAQDVVVARSNFIAPSQHGSAHEASYYIRSSRAVTGSERSELRTLAGFLLRRTLYVARRLISGCVWPSTDIDVVVVLVWRRTAGDRPDTETRRR